MDAQSFRGSVKETAAAIQDAARTSMATAEEHAANLVGETVKSAADEVRARIPASGIAGEVADVVTSGVKQGATYLQEEGLGPVIQNVVAIAKRYPMQTLLLGVGCGFLLFRLRRD